MAVAVAPSHLEYRPQSWALEVALCLSSFIDGVAVGGFTRPTGTFPLGSDTKISAAEGVPVLAMSLAGVPAIESLASSPVLLPSHRIEMARIGAGARATQVIKLQPVWDGATILFVRESVGEDVTPSFSGPLPEHAVASDLGSGPYPTGIRIVRDDDVSGEAIFNRAVFSHA